MYSLSIVIPVFNESENIVKLLDEIYFHLNNKYNYEVIIVDDGSNDNTIEVLENYKKIIELKASKHNVNQGQSYALRTGIIESKNDVIITLDGDGQNNPKDIEIITEKFFASPKYKLIGGIRKKRKDSFVKIVSSRLANFFRMIVLKDNCKDTGCSLKIFDKKIFLEFPFFDGIHRFLPAMFNGYGYKTFFVDVDHRPRLYGKTKYGTFRRLIKGILDIIKVSKIVKEYKNKNV